MIRDRSGSGTSRPDPPSPIDQYEELLNVIPDIVISLSPDGVLLTCSPAVTPLLEFTPEELVGRRIDDLPTMDDEGRTVARTQLPRVLTGQQIGAILLPLRHRNGTRRWFEARSGVVRHPDGRTTLRAVLRDTTERLNAEQRFRAIVDHTNDIIIILDAAGTITFENPAVERVLGFVPGERVGHSILEYAHPDDVRAAVEGLSSIAEPGATTQVTMRFRHKDGSWRHLETHGRNMLHVSAISGILGVGRDITERLRLQERLDAAERLDSIGRLAGGVAHDFNNLLAVILASAEELRTRRLGTGPDELEIDTIVDAADRARELTSKLLTFARREPAEPGTVDVRAALDAASSFLRRVMGETCDVSVRSGNAEVLVQLSPAQFEQLLLNLAANARDAMPDGGAFRVDVERLDATHQPGGMAVSPSGVVAHLTFTDTGVGMSRDVADKAFEPFYTTKGHGKGTGLGLSIVYGIVRQAGGHVQLMSEPQRGTTVDVFLPVVMGAPAASIRSSVAPQHGGGETILVVEDNDEVRRLTVRMLAQVGYRVLESSGGAEALEYLAGGGTVDLVVTDVVMPHMNGVTMAQELRRRHPGMPILFITGYTPEDVLRRQPLDARTVLLTKPFKRDVLLRHVRDMLDAAPI